ncbi:Pentatricopeptide repeat-containing protein [Apostasia shenzhenica]|uniref:Pentatricopeptide repeat-containing protein n=1 Tax=Apostasia shenzhenica TaxID=1088818 RepID=A0A2I0B0T3_9ASPA|nr:Pentatricopeptide repeat-containing protein [Apostasia shenzhenica]
METLVQPPLPAGVSPPAMDSDHHRKHQFLSTTAAAATSVTQFKQLHGYILRSGLDFSFPSLLSKLLSLPLASPPSLDYALAVFLSSPQLDPRLCHRAIRAFSRAADGPRRALVAYCGMRQANVTVDRFIFPPLLRAAARAAGEGGVAVGREAHGLAAKLGFDSDPFVQTALSGAYAAGGLIEDAREVFDGMLHRDVVAWSVMLDGYCHAGQYNESLILFEEMKRSGLTPDNVIFSTILTACGRTGNLSFGKAIHSYIIESNVPIDGHIQSSLVTMYSNCHLMETAQKLYDEMSPKNMVASTAMVFGYCKIGEIEIARSIFDQMADKDLVSWSAMISGYAESERPAEALRLFNELLAKGMRPDRITMLSVISACAHLGALDQAKWVHIFVDKNDFRVFVSINNALIDMYAKCGSLVSARMIFDSMSERNVVTWTSMITGFAMHGEGRSALELFDEMKAIGIEANVVTFVGLLYACSHAGMVEDGRRIFKSMVHEHKIEPKHEHYGCMVDLLGRAKLLQEALELIESMPFPPNVVEWGSLLGACLNSGNIELGEHAANRLLELDPTHDGALVLLSNIYAKANRWQNVGEVRSLMKGRAVSKERGCSWIEIDGEVHEFLMGDKYHSKSDEIYEKLDEIVKELEAAGYSPDAHSVLVNLEEDEKRDAVLWHSEKLAFSFGLLASSNGSCIRISKNLRICRDCHSFMKLASRVFEREISLRDRNRFHLFKDGNCSCNNFW